MRTDSPKQTWIDFDPPVEVPPPAAPSEVQALETYLAGKGWVRAREIILDGPTGIEFPAGMEGAKRKLRTIAEAGADRILSFPGSQGYHVLREANLPDIDHGVQAHRRQARKHIRRAVALMQFKHGRTRA